MRIYVSGLFNFIVVSHNKCMFTVFLVVQNLIVLSTWNSWTTHIATVCSTHLRVTETSGFPKPAFLRAMDRIQKLSQVCWKAYAICIVPSILKLGGGDTWNSYSPMAFLGTRSSLAFTTNKSLEINFCYVMLCYMVICKAPLTGGYSEALSA